MNAHAFEILQLPAILDLVAGYASSDLGAAAVRRLRPSGERSVVAAELERVAAVMALITRGGGRAVPAIPDLLAELRRLAKDGSVWDGVALHDAARLIRSAEWTRAWLAAHVEALPALRPLVERLVVPTRDAEAIERTVDESGAVRDDASPALSALRRDLRSLRATLVQRLERYAAGLPEEYRVEDASVSVREGRYVLAIRREGRSHVGGIVHDESATGGTLFVEPPVALELMNRLRELELAEAREVHRILAERTDALRPHRPALEAALDALVDLDSLYARARYALEHDATPPALTDGDYEVIRARHPLLLAGDREVVPFDLRLERGERTLVVSGPNTGGKTVLLKALGALSLMTQAGVIPPVGAGTKLPVFRDVFADIGDEQSIEASLSTFSAHLGNLREIMAQADEGSLVLIDEIGSGTDPTEGAALARAVLEALTARGTTTAATSHLGQLKLLAGEVEGVVNASLQFDASALRPTYRLLKGIPGRSYGLAIARRLGFGAEILERAETLLPQGERDVGQLLAELEVKERELEQALAGAERDRAAAEAARADADRLQAELDARGEEVRRREKDAERRARQQARDLLLSARKEVEDAVAQLRSAVAVGADAEAFERAASEARGRVERAARRQTERAPTAPRQREAPRVEAGMAVRVVATGARGTVLEVRDGRATVDAGGVRLDVRVENLEPDAQQPSARPQ